MSRDEQKPPPVAASLPRAYETPDEERPASAEPPLPVLQYETPPAARLPAAAGRHDPYAALRMREYRLYAISYALAVIGSQIQSVAVAWQVYQMTRSPLSLGWVAGVQVIPLFLLALPAGHLIDRFSRRRILLATQLLLAFWAFVLASLSHWGSGWLHLASAIYIVILLNAVVLVFARPARSSLLPQLVPASVFGNAITWTSSMFEISSMAGPALGGLVVARWGTTAAYIVTGAMLLGCFCFAVPLPEPQRGPRDSEEPGLASLLAGVRFVWQTKLLLAAMTLDLFAVLLGGALYLLPIFSERLGHGSLGYGWLRAAPAVGAFAMAMIQAHMPPLKRAGRTLLLAVAAFGAATIVFGLSTNYWLSLFMLALTGAFDNISVVVRHTLVQLLTPDSMRGRVSSVNQLFIGSSNELGGMESGLTAAAFGPVGSVVGGGIGTMLVVVMVAWTWPQVKRLGAIRELERSSEGESSTNRTAA